MAAVNRKISAASARSHTRRRKQSSSFSIPKGFFTKLSAVLLVGLLALLYQAIKPPPPTICGSSDGPPITSSRIKLKDGRHLSYVENGVAKEKAEYKIIFMHGLDACKYDMLPISKEVADEFGVYMVSFDRAGYGESDPDPKRSVKSTIQDVEELADQLGLGSKFFVSGFSLGGEYVWGCLKYIPHRLAGAAIISPASNYWWSGFPVNVTKGAFQQLPARDQWAYRVAHHAPWLTYWWNTQKWFPYSSILAQRTDILSSQDKEMIPKFSARDHYKAQVRQQGESESIHRDLNIGAGSWEFDPVDLENPFPNGEGSVHLWHGAEDLMAPVSLSRFISQQLPWVRYHELPNAGHMILLYDGMADAIVKALVKGDQ